MAAVLESTVTCTLASAAPAAAAARRCMIAASNCTPPHALVTVMKPCRTEPHANAGLKHLECKRASLTALVPFTFSPLPVDYAPSSHGAAPCRAHKALTAVPLLRPSSASIVYVDVVMTHTEAALAFCDEASANLTLSREERRNVAAHCVPQSHVVRFLSRSRMRLSVNRVQLVVSAMKFKAADIKRHQMHACDCRCVCCTLLLRLLLV